MHPPHPRAAGGLPNSWLDPAKKVLKTVRYLDLSNNFIGYSDAGTHLITYNAWLTANWDPATPDTSVAGALETLDLSFNGLLGERNPATVPGVRQR